MTEPEPVRLEASDSPAEPPYDHPDLACGLGGFASTVVPGTDRGTLLADAAWLSARVADTGRRWGHDDPRVNGTLWWYSASSTLAVGPIALLLASGVAPDPALDSVRISLRENGSLASVRSGGTVTVADFGPAYREALGPIIAALAAVSGASTRALWAIATDSIGGRALDVGRELGRIEVACSFAVDLTTSSLPAARFVDITAAASPDAKVDGKGDDPSSDVRRKRFVRRTSCCLIYAATGEDKCVSCPRRTPADRLAQLRARC